MAIRIIQSKVFYFIREIYVTNEDYRKKNHLCRNSQQLAELDRRIRELSNERGEMYKTQSENAQRLVNMNEQLRTKEEKDKKQTEE